MSGRENMGGENTGGKPDAPSVVVSPSIIGEMPDSFEGGKKEEKKKFKSFADAMSSVKQTLQKGEKAVSVENTAAAETQELEKHIKHSLAVGQKWQTKNGRSRLEITQQRKDGTLGIMRSVRTNKNKDAWTYNEKVEFLKSQDVEKELLLEKYALISGTAILLDRVDEVRASALDKEMSVILEKEINPASSGIAGVLEKNADALGDQQYHRFFDDLDRISALVKDIFEQEGHLYNDIKKNDREVVVVMQEMKERLIGLHEELKRLRVSIDRAIKEADVKNEKKLFGEGNVVDIAHYRKMPKSASTSEPSSPTEKLIVTLDASPRETRVPTADEAPLPVREERLIDGKNDEEEKPPRGGRKRKERKGSILIPRGAGVPERDDKPEIREKPTASEGSLSETRASVGPDSPDTDNEAGFAQRKRDQWSVEGEKEADNNEPGGTALTEQKDDRVTEERLREVQAEVALARRQFVKADFNKTSAWNKLKRVLRLQSEDTALGANADVESYHEIYTEKLLLFQDLQLQAIRESGVTGEAMKASFASMLRYFKYDEAVQLYQERTDVRRETLHWGDRVVATFVNIGKEYNKLSLTKKLALSAILIGGSLVTGGASLVVKRFLAGAGASVSIDGVLEKVSDKKEASALEKEVREQIRGLDLSLEVDQNILQKYIQEDIASLNNKLQKKKRDILLRKGMALGVGVGVGAGIASQLVMEHLNGKEVTEAITAYTKEVMENNSAIGSKIPETVTPDLAPDSPPDVDKGFIGEPLPDTPNVDTRTDTTPTLEDSLQQLEERFKENVEEGSSGSLEYTPEAREELAREVLLEDAGKNLLEDYHLTRADGPRGLWGVLDSRLPEGIPEAEKNAMIQRLENLIAERLTEMTPEQQADAGFRSGDINRIYAGETIKFSAVLTPEDVEKIVLDQGVPNADIPSSDVDSLSNESGGGADVVPESEVPDTETLESATGEGVVEASDANSVTDVREYNQEIILGKAYNLQLYKEYFRAHQEMLPIFRASGIEYMDFISRDNAGTMRTIGEKTFTVIEKSPLMEKTDLKEFIGLAEETYGKKLGSPRLKEKVYEYVMRMAMLGVEDPEERIIPLSKRFSV